MTTEIGWEKQLIDGIADTLVSVHPICNHSIPQRDDAACPAQSGPVPMLFFSITFVIFVLRTAQLHLWRGHNATIRIARGDPFLVRPK
jgi:hypothetical protein